MIVKPDKRLGFRALNIQQPWASEIERSEKLVEYRVWSATYRGDLLIVASASPRIEPYACTVCVVELHNVRGQPGDYEWLLRNPRPVARVKVSGRLKFWDPGPALLAKLGIQIQASPQGAEPPWDPRFFQAPELARGKGAR